MTGTTRAGRRRPRTLPKERTICSGSPEETHRLGVRLAGELMIPGVVLLCGPLGTGKTTLARGIAAGLGLPDPAVVHSPSFTLVNVYQGRCPIYHVDLYRLGGERDLSTVGLDDFLGRDGVSLVEWGERLGPSREADLVVELEDAGGERRKIHIIIGPRRSGILRRR